MEGLTVWTDARWRASFAAWIDAALRAAGERRIAEPDEVHRRPWSVVWRLETDGGVRFAKAGASNQGHEPGLVALLGRLDPTVVEPPLAVDVDRGWLLLADGGGRLRDVEDVDALVASLVELLPRYARLQRASAAHVQELVTLGVPDHRPAALVAALRRLLRRRDLLVGDFEDALEPAAIDELGSLLPRIGAALARLHDGPIPAGIEHNDLHDGNIFAAGAGRVFDWGDAVIGHPCFSIAILTNSIADRFGLPADAAALRRLRAAYAEAWSDLAPLDDVERLTGDAISLGSASRAVSWGGVLAIIPADEMEPWRAGAAAWLGELLGVARELPDA